MTKENTSAPAAENKMGTMPIGKLLFNMSLPMMISMLVQALYNIVDSIFVAKLSENALTAVSLAFPLQTLLIAVATGTGVGMNALLSRSLGEHKFKEANKIGVNAAFLYFLSYLVFLILGFTVVKPFYASQIKGADAEIMEMGIEYLRTVMIFSFGLLAQIYFERLLTSTGKTLFSMTSQLCGALTNIILDPILIFGVGSFPGMGIKGAALATGIGQMATVVLYVGIYIIRPISVKISICNLDFKSGITKRLYAIGIPAILNMALPSLLISSLNAILAGFSESYVMVLGVYYKLQTFLYLTANGIVQGIRPLVGYNYGAGEYGRVHKIFNTALTFSAVIMVFGTGLCLLMPEHLIGMFTTNTQTIQIGASALRIISIGFAVSSISVTACGALEGLNMGTPSLIISLLRYVILIIPAAFVLSRFLGAAGVWHAFWITEWITAAASWYIYRKHAVGNA